MTPISAEIHFRDLLRLSSPSHEISYATMAATKNLISELPGRSKLQAGVLVGGFWGTFDQLLESSQSSFRTFIHMFREKCQSCCTRGGLSISWFMVPIRQLSLSLAGLAPCNDILPVEEHFGRQQFLHHRLSKKQLRHCICSCQYMDYKHDLERCKWMGFEAYRSTIKCQMLTTSGR